MGLVMNVLLSCVCVCEEAEVEWSSVEWKEKEKRMFVVRMCVGAHGSFGCWLD